MKRNRLTKALKGMALTAVLTLTCGVFASCGNTHENEGSPKASDDRSTAVQKSEDIITSADEDITVGSFVITLREDKAPITCKNFKKLVNSGFYDGLTFHRVVADFMAQGGDPEGNGTGGSGEHIKGEFSNNGVENDLKHVRGTVSMARSQEMDSASSQFFICYKDCNDLDGNYAAFGEVSEGMEVVDRFLNCERTLNEINELASPVYPITITQAEMISADAEGHERAMFTVEFKEVENNKA